MTVRLEKHRINRTGWLRAAVLGANDGLISTASLLIGVSSAGQDHIMLTGIAGLVAGSMSMAAGEYVSVHSQADIEQADINRERAELQQHPTAERRELTAIYVRRGISPKLAAQVAGQLMRHNALAAHARDELGISTVLRARPVQAALASAASFALGAALPLTVSAIAPPAHLIPCLTGSSLLFLGLLGLLSAYLGKANQLRGAGRVMFWGVIAMAVTAGVGRLLTNFS